MSIPRKRSRKFDLDGRKFIYIVKETTIPGHPDQKEISVTVQEDVDHPRRVMQFRAGFGVEITPSLMKLAIQTALNRGWNPSERGGGFILNI